MVRQIFFFLLWGVLLMAAFEANGQPVQFSLVSDTVCNKGDGGSLDATRDTIVLNDLKKSSSEVTIGFYAKGDFNIPYPSNVDDIDLKDEDNKTLASINNSGPYCEEWDTVIATVSAETFNDWLLDDTIKFFLEPGNKVNAYCSCDPSNTGNEYYQSFVSVSYQPGLKYQRTYGDSLENVGNVISSSIRNFNFIASGYTNSYGSGGKDVFLMEVDEEGIMQWSQTYGGLQNEEGKDLVINFDSTGYLILGQSKSYGQGEKDLILVKTDSGGNQIWGKSYGGKGIEEAYELIKTSDSNYLVIASTTSFGVAQEATYLLKIDSQGNVLWDFTYGDGQPNKGMGGVEDQSGDFVIVGSYGSDGEEDVMLMKLDDQGNLIDVNTYGGTNQDLGTSVTTSSLGNYLVAGKSFSFSADNAVNGLLLKLAKDGSILDFRAYGGNKDDYFYSIKQMDHDSFLLSGFTKSYGNGGKDGLHMKIDQNGMISWANAFGGTKDESIRDATVVESKKGETDKAIGIGSMNSYGFGKKDLFINRVGKKGDGACNQVRVSGMNFPANSKKVKRTFNKTNVNTLSQDGLKTKSSNAKSYLLCPVNADFIPTRSCWKDSISFIDRTFDTSHKGYSWQWNFEKDITPENNDTIQNPFHSFSDTGDYKVQLIASSGVVKDSVTKNVSITSLPVNILTPDSSICSNDSVLLELDSSQFTSFEWSPGNLVSDSTIEEPYAYADSSRSLTVKATTSKGCKNYDTIQILPKFPLPDSVLGIQGKPGNLEVSFSWEDPSNRCFKTSYFSVLRRTKDTQWELLGRQSDTSFTDSSVTGCNQDYFYKVLAHWPLKTDTSFSRVLKLSPYDTSKPLAPALQFASINRDGEVAFNWDWDTTSDQKYFEIWRDQGNGNFNNLDTVTYDSTYLDTTATHDQTPYAYFVRAIDSCAADGTIGAPGNRSAPSDTDRIVVPEVETGACKPEARLNWTPYADLPEGTDYYRIHRKGGTSNNFQQVATRPDTSFTDTTILDGNEYCYRIEAVDIQSGYTAYSDSVCMEPFVYPIPDTSKVIRATVEATDENMGEILVEWERAPESDTFARGYFVYHRNNNSATYNLIHNQTDLEDTTYLHQGINTSKLGHEYRIVIYNLCVEQGGYRNVHRPPKISGHNQNLSIALNWWPYQGFDVRSYEVQRSVNGGAFNTFQTFNPGDTSFTDSTVRCGQQYTYRIYAEGNGPKEQSLSDTITFTAYDTISPDRAQINRGTITQTGEINGIAELDFEPATQANRKGYFIYRSEDNSRFVPVDTAFTKATNTITYEDTRIKTKDTRLGYYVRTFDSCGNVAAPSDTHLLINLKAEPKNLANEVSWNAYEGWNDWYYELQRRKPSTNWQTLGRLASDSLSYTDSTKNCDTLYYYRVKATNTQTGAESYSNYDTARSIDQTAPEPPRMERVTVEENGDVQVEWQASPSNDLEYYHLFRQPASSNNFQQATSNLTTLDFTDDQTQATEEPISYRNRSEDSCSNVSEPSGIHTTIHLTAEPGQEQNKLTWTAYGGWDVANYQVYKDGNQVAELGADRRSYTDVRAVCTTFHKYRLRASKANDEEVISWSNIDSAQARDNNSPQAVNLKTATVIAPNEVVEVRWEASADYDADGYEIYRSGLNNTGLIQIATIKDAETTRFRDTLNQPTNQQFCYQVRVKDFCGNVSERSNKGCMMGIEGEATDGANQLTWDEYYEWPGNIAYYEVYKKEDSNFYEQIGQTEETNYTDENLTNQVTDFCYQVEARHSAGNETSRSFEVCLQQPQIVYIPNSFTPGTTEGWNDEFGPEGLYIENFEMQIFNRWGEKVFSTSKNEQWDGTYEGQPVPAGVYLYSISVIGENGATESYEGSVNVVR